MDNSRNYILDRITSKKTSIDDFNYDALQAPPISMFLSYEDIAQLRYIATSIKLSSKAQVRYQMIHEVMKHRGMIKVGAGTNRVIYAHPDYPDIVFKIAADDVGMGDNPAEYRNQFIIKPFCAKTFEVTPCGTVAIAERVIPITSREEYLSVVSDVYDLINEWLIGEYVLSDFGSRYFMNVGVRRSFGVVLLDYTYIYKLDGSKLFCNKPEPLSPSGKCDGIIDYDAGYNELICTKCGAKYKAKELEKKILDKELIVEREGEINMEFIRNGGSQNFVNNKIESNRPSEILGEAKNYIPRAEKKEQQTQRPARRSIDFSTVVVGDKADNVKIEAVRTTSTVEEPVVEEPKAIITENPVVNGVATEPVVVEDKVEEPVVVKETSPKRPMVSFSDEVKKEAMEEAANKVEEDKTPVRVIEDSVKDIIKALDSLGIDVVKKEVSATAIANILGALRKEDADAIVISELDDRFDSMNPDNTQELLNVFVDNVDVSINTANAERDGNDYIIDYSAIINTELVKNDITIVADKTFDGSFIIPIEDSAPAYPVEESKVESEVDVEEEAKRASNSYGSMRMYDAKIMNIKELFPKEQPTNAIIIYKEDGSMLTIDDEIIAIDTLNGKSMNSISIVSKAWFDGLNKDDDVTDVDTTLKSAGMSVDDFIKAEEAAKEEE